MVLEGFWFELISYADANHAGCNDDCKSTSGGIQFLEDKLVSWSSKKQDCTAMSSAEAECVSMFACCAQVIWMRTQLLDYGFRYNQIPIYCDSQSVIAISCNPVQHSRTKHINIRHYFINEHVEKGTIELYFVRTKYQLADLFTKALPKERRDEWEIRIKQYFQIQDYALWEVIEYGNSWVPIPITTPESGPSTALKMTVPSTTEEKILWLELKSMFIAIKARFGGNDATKKTQKALLKQQYENFNATSSESLDSIFNRLQKLVSRLAILGVDTSPEDLNVKFLRSLP
ncbi:hypothetical protein Tco_1506476 [Tanacetum coccineum]